MRKAQVFLREDQKAALKSLSARSGQKQSALIRKGVDLLIDRTQREDSDWRQATCAAAGIWKDRADLEEGTGAIRAGARPVYRLRGLAV